MPYGELSFAGGLINGIAQAQMQRMQNAQSEELAAQKSEESKLKQQMLKLEQQKTQLALKEAERKNLMAEKFAPVLDIIVGRYSGMLGAQPQAGGGATPSGAQLGESITGSAPKQGVADTAAIYQMMMSDPILAAAVEEYGSMPGAGKMPDHMIKREDLDRKQAMDEWNKAKAAGEVQYHPLTIGGEQLLVPTYKNPELRALRQGRQPGNLGSVPPPLGGIGPGTFTDGSGGGMPGGVLRGQVRPESKTFVDESGRKVEQSFNPYTETPTGPRRSLEAPLQDKPIPLDDLPKWVNPDTMQRAPAGVSAKQAGEMGYVQIPTTQLEKVQKIESVKSVLEEVEKMMRDVIPTNEKAGVFGGMVRKGSAALQLTKEGQKLAVLRDYIAGNKAQVAKALGEVGNLSESEQKDVLKMFGEISDSGPKAWSQFGLLKKTFDKSKDVAFGRKNQQSQTRIKYNPSTGKLEPVE